MIPLVAEFGPTIEEVLARPSEAEIGALIDEANSSGHILAARHYESGSMLYAICPTWHIADWSLVTLAKNARWLSGIASSTGGGKK